MEGGLSRFQRNRTTDELDRVRELALLTRQHAEQVQGTGVLRLGAQRCFVESLGGPEMARLMLGQGLSEGLLEGGLAGLHGMEIGSGCAAVYATQKTLW
jgi:hypothetical protein